MDGNSLGAARVVRRPAWVAWLWTVGLIGWLATARGDSGGPALQWPSPAVGTVLRLGKPQPLSAQADGGLPVTFRVVAGPAVIDGNAVVATNVGTVLISAETPGDATHAPARLVRRFNPVAVRVDPAGEWPGVSLESAKAVVIRNGLAVVAARYGGVVLLDLSDPASPRRLGRFATTGDVNDLIMAGARTVFLATGEGLEIVDVGDPANPVRLGAYRAINALAVAVSGNLAFVAAGDDGLRVLDVTDPAHPFPVGGIAAPDGGWTSGVQVTGNIAYVADRTAGLRVIDVANPAAPVAIGHWGDNAVFDVRLDGDRLVVSEPFWIGSKQWRRLDVSDPRSPVAGEAFGFGAVDVRVAGDVAFAVAPDGLEMFDVSVPSRAVPLGTFEADSWADGWPEGLAIDGGLACIAGATGLQILSVATPAGPVSLGNLWGEADADTFGADASGRLVFVADSSPPVSGMRVIDAGDPRNPVPVGRYVSAGNAFDVQVVGNLEYLSGDRLEILDVSVPSTPRLLGTLASVGPAARVTVAGTLACLASAGGPLRIVDVRDPSNPVLLATHPVRARCVALDPSRSLAFVGTGTQGLAILDLRDPSAPVRVGGIAVNGVLDAAVSGRYLVFAKGDRLMTADVSDPAKPLVVGSAGFGGNVDAAAWRMRVAGGIAHVGVGGYGLQMFDVSDPARPAWLGGVPLPGPRSGLAVSGGVAFVTSVQPYLEVVDVAHPRTRVAVGRYRDEQNAMALRVEGNLAYAAGPGLQVFDVSDPDRPVRVGELSTGQYATGIDVRDRRAYLVGNSFAAVDVSVPGRPALLGSADEAGNAVRVDGRFAFVAAGNAGLRVLDVGDPARIRRVATVDTAGAAIGVELVGSVAYVADGEAGLQLVAIDDPAHPALLGRLDTPGFAVGVRVRGDLAFVADGRAGLAIVDVHDPLHPALVSRHETRGMAWSVDLRGDLALVGTVDGALEAIDVANPRIPQYCGGWTLGAPVRGIHAAGDLACVANQERGLQVLRLRAGIAQRLVFAPPQTVTWPDGPVRLVASVDSGLPVTFRLLSGDATLAGDVLVPSRPGRVAVEAEQAGDAQFLPVRVSAAIGVLESRPKLAAPARSDGGRLRLAFGGPAGTRVRVESSADLATWSAVGTVALPATLDLPAVAGEPARFYRTVVVP